jgi:hypothetical protein
MAAFIHAWAEFVSGFPQPQTLFLAEPDAGARLLRQLGRRLMAVLW